MTSFPFWVIAVVFAAFAVSVVLTGCVRRYTLSRQILDIPNERSAHVRPTPRGGGIGFVTVTGVYVIAATSFGSLPFETGLAMAGGLAIAAVGWVDDRSHVASWIRFSTHLLAATWALYWLGGKAVWQFGGYAVDFGVLGHVFAVLLLAWLTNLFNFMDGIDGLAGMEGAFVALAGGVLLWLGGATDLALLAWVLGCACLGFLVWNWAPAKIFMGDIGSATLGFLIGVIAFASEATGVLPVFTWLLLAGVFVVDATLTLLMRAWRGERWYAAHKSHAYQQLVQNGRSHSKVTFFALGINLLLLLPLAIGLWGQPEKSVWYLVAAISALVTVWAVIQWASAQRQVLGNS